MKTLDSYSPTSISSEITQLLRNSDEVLIGKAFDMVGEIEADDVSAVSFSGGRLERLIQFYKTYIEPFLNQNRERTQELWERSQEKFREFGDGAHEISLSEEVLLTCITTDFLRELLMEFHEGELALSKIPLHGLAALAIILVKRVKYGPWAK